MRNTRFCRSLATVLCMSICACGLLHAAPVYATEESYQELGELTDSKEKLEAEVATLNEELAALAAEQEELNAKIAAKESEIADITADLEVAQEKELQQLEAMRLRIKFTYENSGDGFIAMLFGAENMADFINRTEQIELFSTYDHNMLVAYMETKQKIAESKAALETERQEMTTLQTELNEKQDEFNQKIVACQNSIDEYADQIAEVQAQIQAYEERQRQQIAAREQENQTTQYEVQNEATVANASEYQLLAAIIYCEAGNQPQTGKIAVGAVVLNRVRSGRFPGGITDVIYQSGQFTPTVNGALARALATGSYSSCFSAAEAALGGQDPTGGCLFFRTNNGHPGLVIGDHVFY